MRNHFHFLIHTRTNVLCSNPPNPSQRFANFFASYAKAFNRTYGRTGSVFEHPFRRVEVTSDAYFCQLIVYIHRNPQHHGFTADFRDWPFSSYKAILSPRPTRVRREAVLEWFGGRAPFLDAHDDESEIDRIKGLLLDTGTQQRS